MGRIVLILLLTGVLFSCRSKKYIVERSEYQKQTERFKRLDSLYILNASILKEFQNKSLLESTRFELISEKDSNGNVQPLEYTYEINGKVIEKIRLSGGTLLRSKDTKNQVINQKETEKKAEKSKVFSEGKNQEKKELKTVSKQKEIKGNGFPFGVYIIIGLAVILLVFLSFLKWRLKLF